MMPSTLNPYDLDDIGRRCVPFLSEQIISRKNIDEIRNINKFIKYSRNILFEVYLKNRIRRVDYCLGFTHEKDDRETFLNLTCANSQTPHWQNMHLFASAWCDPDSEIGRYVSDLWLEFDAGSRGPSSRAPSLFFSIGNDTRLAEKEEFSLTVPLFEIARRIFSLLNLNFPFRTLGNLERSYNVFAPHRIKIYTGIWFSRSSETIRLVPMGFNQGNITGMYAALKEVGLPGAKDAYQNEWYELVHEKTILNPALDIGEKISPNLRLEMSFGEQKLKDRRLLWQEFMEKMVSKGLCLPQRRDAVLRWPGGNRLGGKDELSGLLWDMEEKSVEAEGYILGRDINHVKISFFPHRKPETKAYLMAFLSNTSGVSDQQQVSNEL